MKILYLGPPCSRLEAHLGCSHDLFRTEEAIDLPFLQREHFDFCLSYRYKRIIRPAEIGWFGNRIINLHISFLPWNRGADPNLWSYLEDTRRGVSIHRIDAGIDTGPVLLQEEVAIDIARATLESSWLQLSTRIETLFEANSEVLLNGGLQAIPQDEKAGSFHRVRDKEPFATLWAELGWKTPVRRLLGKAVK